MKAGVGDQLTIKGRNFQSGKRRNTMFFKAGAKPAVAGKAEQATRTTIKVTIPATLEKYLAVKDGAAQPTRVRRRVLAKRFAKSYTAVGLSPLVTLGNATAIGGPNAGPAADCDADWVVNNVDADDDNDLLAGALDNGLKLNSCKADTDGDGMEDGWEYQSALDLTNTGETAPLPYPGKRPYPNPLDGGDGGRDYDGDVTMAQEHLLWRTLGAHDLVLFYSGGLKYSIAGLPYDGGRDADADALPTTSSSTATLSGQAWWSAVYTSEQPYPDPYAGTSAIDPDSAGDGKLDGPDDNDHDLWTNAEEVDRFTIIGPSRGDGVHRYKVQPFNPCLPDDTSPTCTEHPPVGSSFPPFNGDPNVALPPPPLYAT